jgi:hypothetical protein
MLRYNPNLTSQPSHDTDADSEAPDSAVPPIKIPGKNLNRVIEKKKKTKSTNLRV